MEIIEYEPINLYDGRFCKVFHSDWIQLEKPKDVNLAPHFHWHNSFEFNCSISGTLLCEIGSTMAYVKDNDFLFVNPNVIHKSLENSASFLGFAVLVPVSIIQLFFNPDSKNSPIIEQDVVNRHRKEIMGLLMDIYRYSRSEKPVDLLGMNACVLQIFHILLSESMATPALPNIWQHIIKNILLWKVFPNILASIRPIFPECLPKKQDAILMSIFLRSD